MSNLKENLASQMKDIRTMRKMSLSEVSVLAFNDKTRKGHLSKIENEKLGITVQTIEKIFEALNCSLVVVPNEKIKEVKNVLEM